MSAAHVLRVKAYLDAQEQLGGLDHEVLHTVHVGTDDQSRSLLASDLRELIAALHDPKHDGQHAARAIAQWELGHPDWATRLFAYLRDDDPKETARSIIGDEDFEVVWEETT